MYTNRSPSSSLPGAEDTNLASLFPEVSGGCAKQYTSFSILVDNNEFFNDSLLAGNMSQGLTTDHVSSRSTDLVHRYSSAPTGTRNTPLWRRVQDPFSPLMDFGDLQPLRDHDTEPMITSGTMLIQNTVGLSPNSSLEVHYDDTSNVSSQVGAMSIPMNVDALSITSGFQPELDAFDDNPSTDWTVSTINPVSLFLPDMDFTLFEDTTLAHSPIWKCGRNNCAKTFTERYRYNNHVLSHDRFHICPFKDCTFSAYQEKDVRRHGAAVHRKSKYPCPFQDCPYSDMTFKGGLSRPDALTRHLRKKHANISIQTSDNDLETNVTHGSTEFGCQEFSAIVVMDGAESNGSSEWTKL